MDECPTRKEFADENPDVMDDILNRYKEGGDAVAVAAPGPSTQQQQQPSQVQNTDPMAESWDDVMTSNVSYLYFQ